MTITLLCLFPFDYFTFVRNLFREVLNKNPTSVEFSCAGGLTEDNVEKRRLEQKRNRGSEFLWIADAGT